MTDLLFYGILLLKDSLEGAVNNEMREVLLEAFEASLEAQLRAVRRLRKPRLETSRPSRQQSMSQLDMAEDVLGRARSPLHISDILARIQSSFSVTVDRESLVSSLSKKVARGHRFLRTSKNTFALRPDQP